MSELLQQCRRGEPGSFESLVRETWPEVFARWGGDKLKVIQVYELLYRHFRYVPGAERLWYWLESQVEPSPPVQDAQLSESLFQTVLDATGSTIDAATTPSRTEQAAYWSRAGAGLLAPVGTFAVLSFLSPTTAHGTLQIPVLSVVFGILFLIGALLLGKLAGERLQWKELSNGLLFVISPLVSAILVLTMAALLGAVDNTLVLGEIDLGHGVYELGWLTHTDLLLQEISFTELGILFALSLLAVPLTRTLISKAPWVYLEPPTQKEKMAAFTTVGLAGFMGLAFLLGVATADHTARQALTETPQSGYAHTVALMQKIDRRYLDEAVDPLAGYECDPAFWLELVHPLFQEPGWQTASYRGSIFDRTPKTQFYKRDRPSPFNEPHWTVNVRQAPRWALRGGAVLLGRTLGANTGQPEDWKRVRHLLHTQFDPERWEPPSWDAYRFEVASVLRENYLNYARPRYDVPWSSHHLSNLGEDTQLAEDYRWFLNSKPEIYSNPNWPQKTELSAGQKLIVNKVRELREQSLEAWRFQKMLSVVLYLKIRERRNHVIPPRLTLLPRDIQDLLDGGRYSMLNETNFVISCGDGEPKNVFIYR